MADDAQHMDGTLPAPGGESVALEDLAERSRALPAPPAPPGPGGRVGRFEVVRELGRGGFGLVLEALDPELERSVALKLVLPGEPGERAGAPGREEARAVARLSHPNIVHLHDSGVAEAGPYLVFELLRGEPLSARLARGPLGVPEAARIALEVAKGLAHAHANGVVHRDLKPSNVFLCDDGQVKVLDFGLALVFGRRRNAEGGTPGWMAPEQRRGAPEDERTDVWALGAILFRALAGRDPARSRLELPGAPDLEVLVASMLESDPALRPRNGRAVVDALGPVVRRLESAPPPGSPRVHAVGTVGGLGGSAKLGLALAALSAATVLTLVGFGVSRLFGAAPLPPLPPGDRPLVVVADFANATGDPELEGLSGLLITSLEQSRRVTVLTRARMFDLLRQLGKEGVERVDETLGREVARAAGAKVLLAAGVRRFDDLYSVELKGLDPGTSTYLFSFEERARGKSAIPGLVDQLSDHTREALRESAGEVKDSRIEVARAVTGNVAAYARYFKGEELLSRGEYDGAVRQYEEALALDPGFALPQLAIAYLSEFGAVTAARERAAWTALDLAVDRLPAKERLLTLAWKAHRQARDVEARRLYAEAAGEFPTDKQVLYLAGDLHHHGGEPEAALGYFRRAIDQDPSDPAPAGHAIHDLMLLGRPDEALALALRSEAADPRNAFLVSRAYQLRGEPERALALARSHADDGTLSGVNGYLDRLLAVGDLGTATSLLGRFFSPGKPPEWSLEGWHCRAKLALARGRAREAAALALRGNDVPGQSPGWQVHAREYAVAVALGSPHPGDRARVRPLVEWLARDGPVVSELALLAEVAGEPALSRASEERCTPRAAGLLAALRAPPGTPVVIPAMPDGDLGRFVALVLAQRAGDDAETVRRARQFRRFLENLGDWRPWAVAQARVIEAAALAHTGDRDGAREALTPLVRTLDGPDPELPWMPEYRRLVGALGPFER